MREGLLIGWTSCEHEADAARMAHALVSKDLVVCVQIDPIRSFYKWQDAVEDAAEFRLTLKFSENQLQAIESYIYANHPYENPQWIVVQAAHVSPKYMDWVLGRS